MMMTLTQPLDGKIVPIGIETSRVELAYPAPHGVGTRITLLGGVDAYVDVLEDVVTVIQRYNQWTAPMPRVN
jgi:hypothetical protein